MEIDTLLPFQDTDSASTIDLTKKPTVFKNESAPLDCDTVTDIRYDCFEDAWVQSIVDDSSILSDKTTDTPQHFNNLKVEGGLEIPNKTESQSYEQAVTVGLPFSTLTDPRSLYDGFIAPAPEARESRTVEALLALLGSDETYDFIEFELNDFSIYIDTKDYPHELRPLQHLSTKHTATEMFFDGVLRYKDTEFYVKKARFSKLPIGNYDVTNHTVGDQVWIHSALNDRLGREVYYRLRSPSIEYRRFFTPFLWVADLAKHVADYCESLRAQLRRVTLRHFESDFSTWASKKHRGARAFQKWHSLNRTCDFRGAVVANIDYLWKEAHGLDPKIISWHPLWKEVKTRDYYTPNLNWGDHKGTSSENWRTSDGKKMKSAKTVVTPYIHDLFSHMVFGALLESTKPAVTFNKNNIHDEFLRNARHVKDETAFTSRTKKRSMTRRHIAVSDIQAGDVISTKPDDDNTNTQWKTRRSKHYQGEHLWFGLVQTVHKRANGRRSFDVLWLYQPVDTPCSVMKYPWDKELFLSDNCTCHRHGKSAKLAKVEGHQILGTHEVEWFGDPTTSAEFFVRQTYVASECRWSTLKTEHLICGNETIFSQQPVREFCIGDAVLVRTQSERLETFVIEGFFQEEKSRKARVRRLPQRRHVDQRSPRSRPNELVYSQELVEIRIANIDRRFLLRAFTPGEKIPSPYNRDGTGDAFFITHEEVNLGGTLEYHPFDHAKLEVLQQGFDPSTDPSIPKLQGLDLFCGGGNFGRGIESGGAVEMRWTNDIWSPAIHTYMANSEPDRCTPYLGSVDSLLGMALKGDKRVPTPGDVHFISAGSPCPGFSSLTADRTTPAQMKNQSLVASFASYVDFYRPLYGLLENVPKMVNSSKVRDACVFSQLVCALVGLGYQVQVLFLDAWAFGASQHRSRVFLSFTAPGLRTPKKPAQSHSHPKQVRKEKLGVMSCGRPFDERTVVPTPFKFVGMREAVGDLPDISDGKADCCLGYPDHHLSIGYTSAMRKQVQHIPTHPYCMNFSKAWFGTPRVLSEAERLLYPPPPSERTTPKSNGWGRIDPNNIIGTISTCCLPTDLRTGQLNHWEQGRPITILEARRAQGFLDNEVIIGSPSEQYRIVGNSVSRHVSLVLGLAIREAWVGTLFDEGSTRLQLPVTVEAGPDITIDSVESIDSLPQPNIEAFEIAPDSDGASETSEEPIFTPSSHTPTPATRLSADEDTVQTSSRKRQSSLLVELISKRQRQIISQDMPRNYPDGF
ncbi:S-adenosyl-L-methionine-dependent methyltransferase [Xylariaceae sp. FL1019]|nr:S-adenosyl-L-methionine-dependent methyltransferase [Xylariaceae sp. FL1019]